MDKELIDWLLENSSTIDNVLMIVGVVIEVLICIAFYVIWKHWKKKND